MLGIVADWKGLHTLEEWGTVTKVHDKLKRLNSCSDLNSFHNQEKNRSIRALSPRNNVCIWQRKRGSCSTGLHACICLCEWECTGCVCVCVGVCHLWQSAHYQDRSVQSHLDQWFSPASISSSQCHTVRSPPGVVWVTPSFLAVPWKLSKFQKICVRKYE